LRDASLFGVNAREGGAMHSFIFRADKPESQGVWEKYLKQVNGAIRPDDTVAQLSENMWQVDKTKSPRALGYLIAFADELQVSYRMLPFEHEPQWLPV
jgi:hypothetical protein